GWSRPRSDHDHLSVELSASDPHLEHVHALVDLPVRPEPDPPDAALAGRDHRVAANQLDPCDPLLVLGRADLHAVHGDLLAVNLDVADHVRGLSGRAPVAFLAVVAVLTVLTGWALRARDDLTGLIVDDHCRCPWV